MTGQQNDGIARMESKLDRFVEQYQIDMNGEGDKPGIKKGQPSNSVLFKELI